jgi:hypothetical protein
LVFEKILKIMEKARNCLPFDSILDRYGAAIIEDVCLLANSMVSD